MKRLTAIVFPLTILSAQAFAQSTAITYQGRLTDAGAPAEGLHDFRVKLFSAASGGTQLGATQCLNNVLVSEGVFTATVDFGNQFTTPAPRFVEIEVRDDTGLSCSNTSGFTLLSPRQPLTATPLAIHAESAFSLDAADGSPVDALLVNNAGDVGIGTSAPFTKLHVIGGLRWGPTPDSARSDEDSSGLFLEQRGTSLATSRIRIQSSRSGDLTNYSQFNIDPNTGFSFMGLGTGNSNVGIGTSTPGGKLGIETNGPGSVLIGGQNTGSGGRTILQLAVSAASNGYSHLQSITASGVDWGTLALQPLGGNVAIGTTVAHTPLTFGNTGGAKISLWGNGPSYGFGMDVPNSVMQIYTPGPTGDIAFGHGTSASFTENMRITGGGTTRVKVLEITGADLAEKFPSSDEKVEPGTVMEIDPENAGKLRVARGTYNPRVAGVVSGANDFSVGAVLGNLPGHEDAPPIALSGRVYVWCDASSGAIEPGDRLTTSETPGHAMKAADRDRSDGAVIGKAMERLESGRGLVLVLVNLQ